MDETVVNCLLETPLETRYLAVVLFDDRKRGIDESICASIFETLSATAGCRDPPLDG